MEVQVETPGGLRREMRVRIPADRVSQAVEQRLRTISQRARLPGFRPGKAPMKVIQQQYGMSARIEAVSELVERSYPEAVMQSGVKPVGQPKIDITAEVPGEPLEYVARFEVAPEISLSGFDTLRVERPVVEVTEADVDRLIANLRKSRRTLLAVERPAAAGDVVKINFEGKVDGEAFAGGKGEGVELEIGAGQFLPDLENSLIGHAIGAQYEAPVHFPDSYRAEELRGKTAQFQVELLSVSEAQEPAVDDPEFLQAHAVETAEGLREKARGALQAERDKAVRNRQKVQLMDQLLAANPIEVPQAMIDQEIARMREETLSRMKMPNVPADKRESMLPAELFQEGARKRVALGLLMGEVIRSRQIQLDPQRVDTALDAMAADFEQPEEVKQYYRSRPELMQGLSAMVMEDQVVEALLAGAAVGDQPMSLEQLLNPRAQAAA